ncbi:MAG: rod shape-determining protein MreC [Elusimicrobiota bacterium]
MKSNKTKKIFYTLLIFSTVLLLSNVFKPFREIRNFSVNVLFPSLRVIEYPFDQINKLSNRAGELRDLHTSMENLKKENEVLRRQSRDLEMLLKEYNALRQMHGYDEFIPPEALSGRVILHPTESYFEEFIINRGDIHGVSVNDPVVKIDKKKRVLMGRIKEVFRSSSKVLLITSHKFRAGAMTLDGYRGVISGNGNWKVKLDYISSDADIKAGDYIYTCGSGGIFPQGLAVGQIKKVEELNFSMGKEALLAPFLYPQNARYIHVLIKNRDQKE